MPSSSPTVAPAVVLDDASWFGAIKSNDLTTVLAMLQAGWPVNRVVQEEFPGGRSALGLALQHPDGAMATALLDAGADPHHRDFMGITPLMDACFFGSPDALVQRLIAMGAGVNEASVGGLTPLHWAARQGRTVFVEHLLDAGADPYAQTAQGETAMAMAMAGPRVFHTGVADRLRLREVRALRETLDAEGAPSPSTGGRPRL